jgi:hypothetical protein
MSMTSQQSAGHGGRGPGSSWRGPLPPGPVRVVGYVAAAWCVGFAGVSAWQVAADPIGQTGAGRRYAAYASGLAVMSVLVGVLKLAGAAVALAAVRVRPGLAGRWPRLLGVGLWGAFGVSAAWTAAGGVTPRAVLYVLFFLAGAALFGVLAVWFHRHHHLRWTSAVAGLAGAPLLLALLLAAAPAILGRWGLLPT